VSSAALSSARATPRRRAEGATDMLLKYRRCGLELGNGAGRAASGTLHDSTALRRGAQPVRATHYVHSIVR
jgi:hypothetical protein